MDNGSVAYKCPACGASLRFIPETQDFRCGYCGSAFKKEQLDKPIEDRADELADGSDELKEKQKSFAEQNRLYTCPGCGAAVITDTILDASAECVYCHTPVVLAGRLSGEFRPDRVIPFVKTREDALAQFDVWTGKKKFFLAKGFGSPESLSKIQGIYIPFWLADCSVEGDMTAECYKNVSSVRRGDYIINTESHHTAVRRGSLIFQGTPADGCSLADDALMDSIEPFDYTKLVEFDMSYLSGHNALRYDVSKDMVFGRINERVLAAAEQAFTDTVKGYSRTTVTAKRFGINNINWQLVMMPVWFLTFRYKEKMYYFAMNGQTGKFGGLLPINKLKLALMAYGIPALAALLLGFLAGYLN